MMNFSHDPAIAESQMQAVIFYLTTFGYIDGDFDLSEKSFVRDHIRQLVEARVDSLKGGVEVKLRLELIEKHTAHFIEVFQEIDDGVRSLFTEAVADGEDSRKFVNAKLKLRCYEIFKGFEPDNQQAILETVDAFIRADGVVHPAEATFRAELAALLHSESATALADLMPGARSVSISPNAHLSPKSENHPFFDRFERHYSANKDLLMKQAEADFALIQKHMAKLQEQRAAGAGKLAGAHSTAPFAGQPGFLDGYTYVLPPTAPAGTEVIVLGDLHGCYSCLKAALLQFDFFAKVQAYKNDPVHNPDVKLVMLGDYIDRGRFSYNGVLRTVMQLFLTVPEHVYALRGNHEYYLEHNGKIYGGVRPAEAIQTLVGHMPDEMFRAYMTLFESLPNMLLIDKTLFVHAGIPRDELIADRWKDLSTLNDPDLRFQMLWSDPSEADFIPADLQRENARFPFGKQQFQSFMQKIGCTMMLRGHEKIDAGFKKVYDENGYALLNLFSAGGLKNDDLPEDSNYRYVTPMACTLSYQAGRDVTVTPWEIDYLRYNDPEHNKFFAAPPEIEFRAR